MPEITRESVAAELASYLRTDRVDTGIYLSLLRWALEMVECTKGMDWIAGQVMVCENHTWRLWPDGDEGCPGPGMPLSSGEGRIRLLGEQNRKLRALLAWALEQAHAQTTFPDGKVTCNYCDVWKEVRHRDDCQYGQAKALLEEVSCV